MKEKRRLKLSRLPPFVPFHHEFVVGIINVSEPKASVRAFIAAVNPSQLYINIELLGKIGLSYFHRDNFMTSTDVLSRKQVDLLVYRSPK